MPRVPVIGGNWKMNLTRSEAGALLGVLRASLDGLDGVEVVLFPAAPWLTDAHDALEGSTLRTGAQNVYWEPKGAFTGEVAPPMLRGVVEYALVGHSERRGTFGETVWETTKKMRAVIEAGLTPLLAVGERIEDARAGRTGEVLRRQVNEALRGFASLPAGLVIAYEPVWAIGTGEAATPQDAQQRCQFIRTVISERYGDAAGQVTRVQYGGSVNPENIRGFMEQPDVDGALVGGASLDAQAFTAICRAAAG